MLECLTISLLLSSLHSQDMPFVNSSASILATVQILQCHLICSSNTIIPETKESCSTPWWQEQLVEDSCYIQDSLILLLTFTAMSKQLSIPFLCFADIMQVILLNDLSLGYCIYSLELHDSYSYLSESSFSCLMATIYMCHCKRAH